jgi:hypothetical protein
MFSEYSKLFNKLCKPSKFYFVLSITSIVVMLLQNMFNPRKYCVGSFECDLDFPNIIIFLSKLAYILVWTIIFDSLCKNGYTNLSWGIILVPFVMMFMLVGIFLLSKIK